MKCVWNIRSIWSNLVKRTKFTHFFKDERL